MFNHKIEAIKNQKILQWG